MSVSKTARASMVQQVSTKVDHFDTNEKKIRELQKQRVAKLAVNRYDFIDALLEEYTKLTGEVASLTAQLTEVTARELATRQELTRRNTSFSEATGIPAAPTPDYPPEP